MFKTICRNVEKFSRITHYGSGVENDCTTVCTKLPRKTTMVVDNKGVGQMVYGHKACAPEHSY
uniref:Secreted protein n=1 Tax=Heterorhabditis bacteriophora TaxID=37862 RepID=A0A1I7XN42_HETBA